MYIQVYIHAYEKIRAKKYPQAHQAVGQRGGQPAGGIRQRTEMEARPESRGPQTGPAFDSQGF